MKHTLKHEQAARLTLIFDRMRARYGAQRWWPADSPFEVMVGAVLTQGTAWTNVERAIANLREADALSPPVIRSLEPAALSALIRPAGFHNAKTLKLKALADFIGAEFGDDIAAMRACDTDALRSALLGVYGIGEETADAILLYALDKPAFVIDAYTRRLLDRLGCVPVDSPIKAPYVRLRRMFTERLPCDTAMFAEYHALIVQHCKAACRKTPLCDGCCLRDVCAIGRCS